VIIGNPDLKAKNPGVGTLLDGNPANNFLKRALAFNPDGVLTGARRITIAGTFAVDRYGLKTLDATDLGHPKVVEKGKVALGDPRNIYVARTYAYVADGRFGLSIVNVENPEAPFFDQSFNANGRIGDTYDVKIGMVAASAYAFVADGKNGLRVLQIVSPWDDPAHFSGFSPRPVLKLIATARTRGPALAISKGIDRDRAVDESGNQLAVFGRRGARPLNRTEAQRLYLRPGSNGPQLYTVTDEPTERPYDAR